MARYSVLGDNLLLNELTWPEIEAIYSVQSEPVPRRNIGQHGFVDVPNMDEWTFKRSFRFEKMDLEDLVAALKIPAEVKSAQRVRVPGYEALCMTLRRLAYPNRLCDLERTFGRHSSVISSVVSTVMAHIEYQSGHLLSDLTNHKWLDVPCLKKLSEVRIRRPFAGVCAVHLSTLISGRCFAGGACERCAVKELLGLHRRHCPTYLPAVGGATGAFLRTQAAPRAEISSTDVCQRHHLPIRWPF